MRAVSLPTRREALVRMTPALVVLAAACGDDGPTGPDFDRTLGPREYQVVVTGDIQQSFELQGARFTQTNDGSYMVFQPEDPPSPGQDVFLRLCDYGGSFAKQSYEFNETYEQCSLGAGRVKGGVRVQLAAPLEDELDCSSSGYGFRDFEGLLRIDRATGDELQGEILIDGICSRHPYSETEPMRAHEVSIRIRFRAQRGVV